MTEFIKRVNKLLIENTNAVYKYSTLQYNLPKHIAKNIISFGNTIADSMIYTDSNDPSYGRENDIHMTLLYGIHAGEDPDIIENKVSKQKPFKISLGEISLFEQDDYNVLKIDVILNKELSDLRKTLESNIDNIQTFSSYIPHITIAYVTKDFDISKINIKKYTGIELLVNGMTFCSRTKERTLIPFNLILHN